ncbi:hypothetical protein RB195_012069 [Necator americanus]|uniref:Uncharacterized protein n=1 Tax=Necator americanus TaxID=51031 RepID=A0ABR1D6N1_NECAM
MKVALLILLLLVVDAFSLNKVLKSDFSKTERIGNLSSKEVKKTVGMKKHKFFLIPLGILLVATAFGMSVWGATRG